jgi:Ca2+-binding EF-hand superfamily protein
MMERKGVFAMREMKFEFSAMKDDAGSAPLDEDKCAEVREDFDYFDENHDGLMEFAEFVGLMDGLGADMSSDECRIGFAEIDSDRDGVIELDEFLDWWSLR